MLCFCETWLSPDQPSPAIDATYVVLRCDRATNDHRGATLISVDNNIMQPSNTANFVSNCIECVVTTLHCGNRQLQIAVVYRSPNVPIRQFMDFITSLVHYVNIVTLVLGDFNDDILCDSVQTLMASYGYSHAASPKCNYG